MKTNGRSQATSDFFVAGGTLSPSAPSYVSRPADDALFDLALASEFCYVLTTRQMGKSSLMVRTAHRLRDSGVRTAIIDLTTIGTSSDDIWYLDLLTELANQLNLSEDTEAWWKAHASLGQVRRFTDFLRDVVLAEIMGQIVIFIDEVDVTLDLAFSDDFFAAVRAAHNARAVDSRFNRLTFVFLGVASPPDLIKDRTRTPFNIGQGIILADFDRADAAVLQEGLEAACPGQGGAIFNRIYYWTDGHPYLTQRLCREVVETKSDHWTDKDIDQLVERLFLLERAHRDTNLIFVQDMVLKHPHRRRLLALYRKVYQGQRVSNDEQSPLQNQLKLSGLVKAENGHLRIHNQIYRYVFDIKWIRANTAIDWSPIVAGVAVLVALLAVGVVLRNYWVENQFRECAYYFRQANTSPQKRLTYLARAFRLQGLFVSTDYVSRAREELFYSLSRQDQLALFQEAESADDLVTVTEEIYLALADVDNTGSTTPLLKEMADALGRLDKTKEANLTREINRWRKGREQAELKKYDEALLEYDAAVQLNDRNLATRYERAWVFIKLSKYPQALSDLDQVMALLGTEPTATPSASPVPSNDTAVSTWPSAPVTSTGAPPFGSVTVSPTSGPKATSMAIPTVTPTPTPTPVPVSIVSKFANYGQIRNAVGALIYSNPDLVSFLMSASSSEYPNLRESGLVPTPTITATVPAVAPTTPSPGPEVTDTPVPGLDAFEPNYDFDHAASIGLNVKYTGINFVPLPGQTENNDYFKVRVKRGMLVICETIDLSPGTDTNMIVYDNDRNGLTSNDDVDTSRGELRSRVTLSINYDGFLYILVGQGYSVPNFQASLYNYALQCTTPGNTLVTPTPTPPGGGPTRTPVPSPTPAQDMTPPTITGVVASPSSIWYPAGCGPTSTQISATVKDTNLSSVRVYYRVIEGSQVGSWKWALMLSVGKVYAVRIDAPPVVNVGTLEYYTWASDGVNTAVSPLYKVTVSYCLF